MRNEGGARDSYETAGTEYSPQIDTDTDLVIPKESTRPSTAFDLKKMSHVEVEWLLLAYGLDRLAFLAYFLIFTIMMAMYF